MNQTKKRKVAIMQPYFFPYLPYFQLISSVDIFVIYDCVQFPRRGWVHRNKFTKEDGLIEWLTLPLLKSNRNEKINNIYLSDNYLEKINRDMQKFPFLVEGLKSKNKILLKEALFFESSNLSNYLENSIKKIVEFFQINSKIILSSSLKVSSDYKNQDRIIKILSLLNGTHYINAVGGISIYDPDLFSRNKIKLSFIREYEGKKNSILERSLNENLSDLKSEIYSPKIFDAN